MPNTSIVVYALLGIAALLVGVYALAFIVSHLGAVLFVLAAVVVGIFFVRHRNQLRNRV